MIDLDDLKKRTNMIELCEALGLQPKGKVARCPAHTDADGGRPNLAMYLTTCIVSDVASAPTPSVWSKGRRVSTSSKPPASLLPDWVSTSPPLAGAGA